jgi:hypothetical protein
MRALRISAYLSARTATYWEGLVHAHRDGRHLAPLLPHLIPRLPLWVVPEQDESVDAMPITQALTASSLSTVDAAGELASRPASPAENLPVATTGAAYDTRPGGADGQAREDHDDNQPLPAYRR